jgi:hypothetical protein
MLAQKIFFLLFVLMLLSGVASKPGDTAAACFTAILSRRFATVIESRDANPGGRELNSILQAPPEGTRCHDSQPACCSREPCS